MLCDIDSDLAGDLAARKAGMKATLQQLRRTAGVLRFRSSCARLGRPLGLRCDDHHKKAFSPPEAAIASSREHDAVATVLIIGASRGIGLEAVKAALEAGHSVRALPRVSPKNSY